MSRPRSRATTSPRARSSSRSERSSPARSSSTASTRRRSASRSMTSTSTRKATSTRARLFGIDESVRAGFTGVRLDVAITGPEDAERYELPQGRRRRALPGARPVREPDAGRGVDPQGVVTVVGSPRFVCRRHCDGRVGATLLHRPSDPAVASPVSTRLSQRGMGLSATSAMLGSGRPSLAQHSFFPHPLLMHLAGQGF